MSNTETAITLAADKVAQALSRLTEEGHISVDEKRLIVWLSSEARANNWSQGDVAKRINVSTTTISRIFAGRYEGNYHAVCASIRKYKHISAERARLTSAQYIETSIWHQVRNTCDLALINQTCGMIIGISQIGKTYALQEYARRSDYTVRYVRMPAAPSMRRAVETIARACGVSTSDKLDVLRDRIAQSIDNQTLLVIDEVHQLVASAGARTARNVMEYLREIHDESQCGLVIVGTTAVERDLIDGENRDWLDQFAQRCLKVTHLPKSLPIEDIEATCQAYGLADIPERCESLVKGIRMNRLTKTLIMASTVAAKRDCELTWEIFEAAYHTLNA